jgi:hypothetical protein
LRNQVSRPTLPVPILAWILGASLLGWVASPACADDPAATNTNDDGNLRMTATAYHDSPAALDVYNTTQTIFFVSGAAWLDLRNLDLNNGHQFQYTPEVTLRAGTGQTANDVFFYATLDYDNPQFVPVNWAAAAADSTQWSPSHTPQHQWNGGGPAGDYGASTVMKATTPNNAQVRAEHIHFWSRQ